MSESTAFLFRHVSKHGCHGSTHSKQRSYMSLKMTMVVLIMLLNASFILGQESRITSNLIAMPQEEESEASLSSLTILENNTDIDSKKRRQLQAAGVLAEVASPLIAPLVDLILHPVKRIIFEWVIDPISYEIKKNREPSEEEVFLVQDSGESIRNGANKTTSDSDSDAENRVVYKTTDNLSIFTKALTRRLHEALVPSQLSVLKCGKTKRVLQTQLDKRLVAGNEASLVMKLEGFSPLSDVVLFASQELANDHGIPPPRVPKIEEVKAMKCKGMPLGIGGLIETLDMGLDTPHKIVQILNKTNKDGITFVQRMKFTQRFCSGLLYFQALDVKTCSLTSVVNATIPNF